VPGASTDDKKKIQNYPMYGLYVVKHTVLSEF